MKRKQARPATASPSHAASTPHGVKAKVVAGGTDVILHIPAVSAAMSGTGIPLPKRRWPLVPDEARELAAGLVAAADTVDVATGRKRPRGATACLAGEAALVLGAVVGEDLLCTSGCGGEVDAEGSLLCDNCRELFDDAPTRK